MAALVRLDYPGKDGKAKRPMLESVWEQRQRQHPHLDPDELMPPELVEPKAPEGGEAAWSLFWELSAQRGNTGFGPGPITFEAMEARARLMNEAPEPWQVRAVMAMDRAFLAEAGERGK